MDNNYQLGNIIGISLEQPPLSLVLEYSDSPGIRRISSYRFQIPLSTIPLTVEMKTEDIESSEIRNFKCENITWEEIPEQVIKDALNWLYKNIAQATQKMLSSLFSYFAWVNRKLIWTTI